MTGDSRSVSPDLSATHLAASREGGGINIEANTGAKLLLLTGEPIDEPVVAHGPLVMNTNTEGEIKQTMHESQNGKFGAIPKTV